MFFFLLIVPGLAITLCLVVYLRKVQKYVTAAQCDLALALAKQLNVHKLQKQPLQTWYQEVAQWLPLPQNGEQALALPNINGYRASSYRGAAKDQGLNDLSQAPQKESEYEEVLR